MELELKEQTTATISDITISAGATTGTASFTPTDDSIYEGNETGIVAISTVSGGSATEDGTQSVTITITENETAPVVNLSVSSSSITENSGSSITVTATMNFATIIDTDITISTSGTALEGTDYGMLLISQFLQETQLEQQHFTPTDDSCLRRK